MPSIFSILKTYFVFSAVVVLCGPSFCRAAILQLPSNLEEQLALQRQRTGGAVMSFSFGSGNRPSEVESSALSSSSASMSDSASPALSRDFILKLRNRGNSAVQEIQGQVPRFISKSEFLAYEQDHPQVRLQLVKYYTRLGEVVLRLKYHEETELVAFRALVATLQGDLKADKRADKDVGNGDVSFFREKTVFTTK